MPTACSAPVDVSCCVIARGRIDHLRRLLVGLERQHRPADEVVVVSMGDLEVAAVATAAPVVDRVDVVDRLSDRSLPLARARNAAARRASGDLLVFLDVDCIPAPDLIGDYVEQRRPGLLMGTVSYLPAGVPDTISDWTIEDLHGTGEAHPARPGTDTLTRTTSYELFWSLNFAVDRPTWDTIGGFDETFDGYGGEDTDLGYTARAAGLPAWFLPGAHAFHQHHPVQDPPLQHLRDIVENSCRFHEKWGEWPMTGWLSAFAERGLVDWHQQSLTLRPGSRVS